jgi:hypothetical protein
MSTYFIIAIAGYALAAAFFVSAGVVFIVKEIWLVIGYLTGKTQAKQIQQMHMKKAMRGKTPTRSKDISYSTPRSVARESRFKTAEPQKPTPSTSIMPAQPIQESTNLLASEAVREGTALLPDETETAPLPRHPAHAKHVAGSGTDAEATSDETKILQHRSQVRDAQNDDVTSESEPNNNVSAVNTDSHITFTLKEEISSLTSEEQEGNVTEGGNENDR